MQKYGPGTQGKNAFVKQEGQLRAKNHYEKYL